MERVIEEVVSVNELVKLIETSFQLRKEYEEAKRESDKKHAEYQAASFRAATMLEGLGLDKFHTASGTFSYTYSETWRVPKTPEQREAFFNYLKEKGIYDEMVSVNSNSLNSFAKTEEQNALDEGNFDFRIPGLEKSAPVIKPILRKL